MNNTSLNDFDKQAILRKNYFDFIMDSLYGIHNQTTNMVIRNKYNNIPDPLKMVMKTKEEEGYFDTDMYSKYVGLFIGNGILKFTGMNLNEFLDLPIHQALSLVLICKKYVDTELNALNKANANLSATLKNTDNKMKDKF